MSRPADDEVERVARALWDANGWHEPDADDRRTLPWALCVRQARAAIEAMQPSILAAEQRATERAAEIAEEHQPRDNLLPLCNADMNAGAKRGMYEAAEEIAAAIRSKGAVA